jgi:MFS family permease
VLFGLGFGMVSQVLVVAVQNHVDRRELGIATATTGFFRALGGAVGAAVLGAVFAAEAGARASDSGQGIDSALRADIVDAVQAVFLVATPMAALALLVVLALPEAPLKTESGTRQSGRHHTPTTEASAAAHRRHALESPR